MYTACLSVGRLGGVPRACVHFLVVPSMARLQHLGVSGSLRIRRAFSKLDIRV